MTGLSTKTDFYQLFEKDRCSSRETPIFRPWSLNVGKKIKELLDVSVQQISPEIRTLSNMTGII